MPVYDLSSESAYSLTNLVQLYFGVDIFTLTFIAALYFLASLALVSIVLPNLYFRLMLWADVTDDTANIYDDYWAYGQNSNLMTQLWTLEKLKKESIMEKAKANFSSHNT